MKYITAKEFSDKYGKSYRYTRRLLEAGRIRGARYEGEGRRGIWKVPADAEYPVLKGQQV